ncbi:hypothetical protein Tamer19_06460 [Cupriavidus sp. TA19]|nr:hypothetical protein Tamer19_06460 [Cupriavidus sp. TA19]
MTSTAKQSGWASGNVHLEYLGVGPQNTSADSEFEVKVGSSGRCFTVPANRTVVPVLDTVSMFRSPASKGYAGPASRNCWMARRTRAVYFTDDERAKNDQVIPCCSRAKSSVLVLDL